MEEVVVEAETMEAAEDVVVAAVAEMIEEIDAVEVAVETGKVENIY